MRHQVLVNKSFAPLPLVSLLVKGYKDDGVVWRELVVRHHHPGHLEEGSQPAAQVPCGGRPKVPRRSHNQDTIIS